MYREQHDRRTAENAEVYFLCGMSVCPKEFCKSGGEGHVAVYATQSIRFTLSR